jgi:hypothetical protein
MNRVLLTAVLLFAVILCHAQWGPINNGIVNLTFGAKLLGSSNTHLFSGTLAGPKMYRTNDYGNNWTEIQPPVTGNIPECGYYFSGKYFSGLNSSMDCIFYSSDNGTNWNSVNGGPQTTVVRGFSSISGTIFAFTSSKGVYKSTDGGANWSEANSGISNLNVIWMETINSKIIAATIGAGVFVSADNGASWVQSNSGISGGSLNASFVWRMGNSLYYYDQSGSTYTSSDEGTTWNAWNKPSILGLGMTEVYRSGSNLYLESRHFAVGLRDSIYVSSNEGLNWTNITANLSATDLNASGITEFGGFAFIAYNMISPGMGVYRKTSTVSVSETAQSDLINIYPNPFSEKIIFANVPDRRIKHVSIFDNQGRLILTVNGDESSINTSELNSGLYVIQILFFDNSMVNRKLIKYN